MPGIDASIPLGFQPANPVQTLSGLLNLKTQIQGQQLQQQHIQAAQNENAQSGEDAQEMQASLPILRNLKSYQDDQGNVDFNKLIPDVMQAAPKNGAGIISNIANAQKAHTDAVQSVNSLGSQGRQAVGQVLSSVLSTPDDQLASVTGNTIAQLEKSYPTLGAATGMMKQRIAAAGDDPKAIRSVLQQAAQMAAPVETQQGMRTPGGVAVDNGQQGSVISTKPDTTVPTGTSIPGTQFQHQLPPTTPTVDAQGTPGYLGPQGGGNAVFDLSGDRTRDLGMLNTIANDQKQPQSTRQQAMQQIQSMQGQGAPKSGLPPGQLQNISNNVDQMNQHFAGLQSQAQGAPLVESLRGNIKALANKAITGTESDKLSYVNGLLQQITPNWTGIEHPTDLKTATDLLEKNLTQLNLTTPASTDAARTLVTAGRPNSHMTPQAISDAADQVASQVQANMAIRNVLSGYKMAGDTQGYQTQREKLEKVADPRVWQFANLPDAASKQKFMSNLQPQDRASLVKSTQQLEQMGLIQ